MNRKDALKTLATGALTWMGAGAYAKNAYESSAHFAPMELKGNVNHSVCRWCYSNIELDALCASAREMGIKSVELLSPNEWDVALKYGLTCAMSNGSPLGIANGFNNPTNHMQLFKDFAEVIPKAAEKGIKNVICFSGNRNGMSDEMGLENCAKGLEPVVKLAQKHGITIVMELLNSKVNHKDYQCDHTAWGAALCEKLGLDNFKLLYDIYHMQIMEGDIIATIRQYHKYIAHYHTGGVPGRHEINDSQELYYPAIMNAILATGFKGFVAQEFIPAGPDPLASLKEGVGICDV